MGHYEEIWEERKHFLASSAIIGAIAALILEILFFHDDIFSINFFEDALIYLILFVFFALIAIPFVAIIRMMGAEAEALAIGMLTALWAAILDCFSDGDFGYVFGMLLFLLFGALFLAVCAVYLIYLPISSIYYYIKFKQERNAQS